MTVEAKLRKLNTQLPVIVQPECTYMHTHTNFIKVYVGAV